MASECVFTLTGGAANVDPNASLGGDGSSELLSTTALHNLFGPTDPTDITVSAHVTYRAIDILNNGDALAKLVEFFVVDTTNAESAIAIWYEAAPGQSIADENTAPVGATWTQPLVGTRQSIANIAINGRARIWIRKTVNQNADNLTDDLASLYVWFA
jgi:hypothetical protein